MIVGDDFVWLHLGKTGGKTTRKAISLITSNKNIKKIYSFPDHHFNISQYESKYNKKVKGKVIIGFRKLIPWMHSYHVQQHGNLSSFYDLAKEGKIMQRCGKIFTPDDILKKYIENKSYKDISFLRLENLFQDLNNVFSDFKYDRQKLKSICDMRIGERTYNIIVFSKKEKEIIFQKNPIWSKLQNHLYKGISL
jgi:hypothetical protein